MNDLLLESATRLAERIRAGEVSSREVVEVHVAQIERVNPQLNAVVRTRYDEARAEAERADALRARTRPEDLPPLHGVPCTIKECFALAGMPNASGLVARRHLVSERDATAVARLRAAGAIPLGVTNTSELCMWMESNNRVYGRTNNPYDPARIVGGSSGGEGAIVGAGGSPFGLGSDVGGSIRGPAFFNGVFGHKPTGGMVPATGQYPIAAGAGLRYLTTGPITRRATDLMPLLRVLAGPDGLDAGCRHFDLGDPAQVDLSGRTLLDVPDNGVLRVSPELRRAQEEAVRVLRDRGMRVREVSFKGLEKQFDVWSAMMADAQEHPFSHMLGEGRRVRAGLEIVKHLLGRSQHTLPASLLALVDPVPKLFPGLARRMIALGHELRASFAEALGPDGVLLYPSYTVPAPRHGVPVRWLVRMHHPWAYLAIVNVLELPATQVPVGLGAEGLPLGFQVVSGHGNDHVTIAVAMELERALGGWTPPAMAGLGCVTAA
ncbi:MAG: amidase [Deltaproteobacteria bacterium]|nr:amidase [Deltaproteobacteria bacterium]